jgi:hypothetical protein
MISKRLSLTLTATAILLVLFAASPIAFGYSPSAVVTHNAPSSPSLKTVSVTLTFSPKTESGKPGQTVDNKITIKNTGTTSVKFTGCLYYYEVAGSTKYTKATCSLGGSLTIGAGKSVSGTWETRIISSAPKGTMHNEVYFVNSADESHLGTYTINVT